MHPLPILLTAIALAFGPTLASAACPTNYAQGNCPCPFEPELMQSTSPTWNAHVVCGDVAIDLVAGTVQLSGGGAGGEYSCGAYAEANDEYHIVGPASAVALPFDVRVHVTGQVGGSLGTWPIIGETCNSVSVRFRMTSGASTTEFTDQTVYSPCAGHSFESDLVLHLSKLPGEAFTVQYRPNVQGYGEYGSIRGAVHFEGLPVGYTVQSCQGYGAQPVPAHARTWGELKHTYR
jgi:hypothetical protein